MTTLAMKNDGVMKEEGTMFVSNELAKQAVELHRNAPAHLDVESDPDGELPANTELHNGKVRRRRGRLDITPFDRIAESGPVDLRRARRAIEDRVLGAIGTAAQKAIGEQPEKSAIDFKVMEVTRSTGRAAQEKRTFVSAVEARIVSALEISIETPGALGFLKELAADFSNWVQTGTQARQMRFSAAEDGTIFMRQVTLRADLPPLDRS